VQLRHSDWKLWWDAFSHTWSEGQLAHAWQAFDKVRFFDVHEETTPGFLWLVSEIGFRETTYQYRNAEREGGRPHSLFADVMVANAACARLNAARRDEVYDWWRYRYATRLGYEDQPRGREELVYFEVLPVRGGTAPRTPGPGSSCSGGRSTGTGDRAASPTGETPARGCRCGSFPTARTRPHTATN